MEASTHVASGEGEMVDVIHGSHHALASNALGLTGVLFCIVTGAAPIAAMLFNAPWAVYGAGYAAPAAFIVATVILTIFSVGYIEMARRVSAAGGFYSFVSHGFGQVAGLGTAITITLCYVIFTGSVTGVTSYFANTTIEAWIGPSIPVWAISAFTIALMAIFAFFHIELTARILGVCLISEVAACMVFGVLTLFGGGADGIPLKAINPAEIFSDSNTALGAAGVAMFASFWSWVGFEMAPNYAEESRDPRRVMGPATYISVIGLGVFYTFISWMLVAGWGTENVSAAVSDQFAGNIASVFYPLTTEFGRPLTWAFQLFIVTGSFACQMAFFNTSARYFYSMGRERIIPATFGKTHPSHRSPYMAAMLTTVLVGGFVLGFTLYDSSTLGSILKLGTWGPLMGMLGILLVQTLTSAAIVKYFLVDARDGFNVWKTLIAPILGGVGCIGAMVLMLQNRTTLAGGNPLYIELIWVPIVLFFVGGMALALYYRSKDPQRYAAIGRFVHQDA
jgi:amino acid transporter